MHQFTGSSLPPREPPAAETVRARSMFTAALVWLGYMALMLHFHQEESDAPVFWASLVGLAVLTPVFWVEAWWRYRNAAGTFREVFWSGLIPILRIGIRDAETKSRIWLPRVGWREVSPRLEHQLAHAFTGPMIAVALLVLPVIAIEFLMVEQLKHNVLLARATQFATSVIWWSFTVEFVLMVSITAKRLDYCKRHWLDLAIILLPFLFFLRALRLGQLLRLQNLSKTARVYRLRGVAMRAYRALLLVKAIRQLLQGSPQRRLEKLRTQLHEQELHLSALKSEIAELEAEIESLRGEEAEEMQEELGELSKSATPAETVASSSQVR